MIAIIITFIFMITFIMTKEQGYNDNAYKRFTITNIKGMSRINDLKSVYKNDDKVVKPNPELNKWCDIPLFEGDIKPMFGKKWNGEIPFMDCNKCKAYSRNVYHARQLDPDLIPDIYKTRKSYIRESSSEVDCSNPKLKNDKELGYKRFMEIKENNCWQINSQISNKEKSDSTSQMLNDKKDVLNIKDEFSNTGKGSLENIKEKSVDKEKITMSIENQFKKPDELMKHEEILCRENIVDSTERSIYIGKKLEIDEKKLEVSTEILFNEKEGLYDDEEISTIDKNLGNVRKYTYKNSINPCTICNLISLELKEIGVFVLSIP